MNDCNVQRKRKAISVETIQIAVKGGIDIEVQGINQAYQVC